MEPYVDGKSKSKMNNRQIRLTFVGLAMLAVAMTIVMHMRIGSSSHAILRHYLSFDWNSGTHRRILPESGIFPQHDETNANKEPIILGERNEIDWEKISHKHSHDHNQEVRFVLRESNLGAPAFVGRNILDMDGSMDIYGNQQRGSSMIDRYKNLTIPDWKPVSAGNNSVAIGCAITLRKQPEVTADKLVTDVPFFKGLVASFCFTASSGYDYHFYVGHDHDDPFFGQELSHKVFQMAFYSTVAQHCPRNFNISLHLVECNHTGRPAWAQNDAMMAGYMDNMEYYYRVNDDTVMETSGWTEKLIAELERFNPPKVGVVGPWFKEGNYAILTHDFVHRTHVDVFGFYYPRVFTDWFADDWITGVYRPERCRKVPMVRVKHTMEQGSRYVVHFEKAGKVDVEVKIGKLLLNRWLERRQHVQTISGPVIDSNFVISIALYGNDINQLYGAMRYAQLVPIVYPKWRVRFYSSILDTAPGVSRVLKIVIRKLELSGVEVIKLEKNITNVIIPSLWPYLIMDDLSVERFVVRSPDTRPSEREAGVLEEWLSRNALWHCVRDHPAHATVPLVPSLVGGIPRHLKHLLSKPWHEAMKGQKSDKDFLQNIVWPKVKGHCYCHDRVSCVHWPGAHPFPSLRKDNSFVGQRYDANDEMLDQVDTLSWNKSYTSADCVFVKNTGFTELAVKAVLRHRPVFWSQEFHVSPMMDIKSLLNPIGVKVIDKSLSYVCGSVGTCGRDLKVINSKNGMRLTPNITNGFYEAYKNDSEMAQVSTFVCTLPVAMCEAFASFPDRSMLIIATLRYEMGRPEPDKWAALNSLLLKVNSSIKGVVAANNMYDAKYIQYFTGIKPVVVPNYCAYLNNSYKPERKQFLVAPIHSTQLNDKFFADFDNAVLKRNAEFTVFPLREMYPQYLFSDLAAHPGIIYVPYQVSMISLTDQYRMNIPLFFPSRTLLTKWHLEYRVIHQRTWSIYMNHITNQSAIKGLYPDLPDPNNDLDEEAIYYWLQYADFYRWPHITYYDSLLDLVDKLGSLDLKDISRKMQAYNMKVKHEIKQTWSQILLKLTEGKPLGVS